MLTNSATTALTPATGLPSAAAAAATASPFTTTTRQTNGGGDDHPVVWNASFGDFLDVINPLQHLPIIGDIYRAITGDKISQPARVLGDALYGGPMGLIGGVFNSIVEDTSGHDIGQTVIGLIDGKGTSAATKGTAIAQAGKAGTDAATSTAANTAASTTGAARPAAMRVADARAGAIGGAGTTAGTGTGTGPATGMPAPAGNFADLYAAPYHHPLRRVGGGPLVPNNRQSSDGRPIDNTPVRGSFSAPLNPLMMPTGASAPAAVPPAAAGQNQAATAGQNQPAAGPDPVAATGTPPTPQMPIPQVTVPAGGQPQRVSPQTIAAMMTRALDKYRAEAKSGDLATANGAAAGGSP